MAELIVKAELLGRIQALHAQLAATVAALTPAQLEQPSMPDGWAVKDVLAHITWWEQRMIQLLRSAQRGEPYERLALPDEAPDGVIDRVNGEVFAANRDRPAADTLMERQRSFADVLATIDALGAGDTIDPAPLEAILGSDVAAFIAGDTYEHYAEHDTAIREWLGRSEDEAVA